MSHKNNPDALIQCQQHGHVPKSVGSKKLNWVETGRNGFHTFWFKQVKIKMTKKSFSNKKNIYKEKKICAQVKSFLAVRGLKLSGVHSIQNSMKSSIYHCCRLRFPLFGICTPTRQITQYVTNFGLIEFKIWYLYMGRTLFHNYRTFQR